MEQPFAEPVGDKEGIGASQKTLSVPNLWLTRDETFRPNSPEKKMLELFERHGFEVTSHWRFRPDNPNAFNIEEILARSQHDRDSELARQADIQMPRLYSPQELITTIREELERPYTEGGDINIVAKIPHIHRGELKFLLETPAQKQKFLAWALLAGEPEGRALERARTDEQFRNAIYDRIRQGTFSDDELRRIEPWIFEEGITPPGKYASSLRVIVDGYGKIHYAMIARARHPKEVKLWSWESSSTEKLRQASFSSNDRPLYLTDPASPFYLPQLSFVSNFGPEIILDGTPIEDEENRQLVADLGFDPDNPRFSEEGLRTNKGLPARMSELGRLGKRYWPRIGVDLIKDTQAANEEDDFKLLEIDTRSMLNPKALGLDEKTSQDECELALLENMLNNNN